MYHSVVAHSTFQLTILECSYSNSYNSPKTQLRKPQQIEFPPRGSAAGAVESVEELVDRLLRAAERGLLIEDDEANGSKGMICWCLCVVCMSIG